MKTLQDFLNLLPEESRDKAKDFITKQIDTRATTQANESIKDVKKELDDTKKQNVKLTSELSGLKDVETAKTLNITPKQLKAIKALEGDYEAQENESDTDRFKRIAKDIGIGQTKTTDSKNIFGDGGNKIEEKTEEKALGIFG